MQKEGETIMTQQTSIMAYVEEKDQRDTHCRLIKDIIQHQQPIADFQIQEQLAKQHGIWLPCSTISGRRNDLQKMGMINRLFSYDQKIYNPDTNKSVNGWGCY